MGDTKMAKTTTKESLTPREFLKEVNRLLQEVQKAYVSTSWNEMELKDPKLVVNIVELQNIIDRGLNRSSTCLQALKSLERTYYGKPL
jgi:hypothetical protein